MKNERKLYKESLQIHKVVDVVVCNIHESSCHAGKKCFEEKLLFTFYNMFSNWSNRFPTRFLIGLQE